MREGVDRSTALPARAPGTLPRAVNNTPTDPLKPHRRGKPPTPSAERSAPRPNDHARIGGIILAAGRGARFTASAPDAPEPTRARDPRRLPKTLATFRGRPLVQHACLAVLDADVRQVVAVVGYRGDAVREAVTSLQVPTTRRLEIVDNPRWQAGLSTSVAAGIAQLAPDIDAALLMPADQPLLEARHLRQLIQTFRSSQRTIAAAADERGTVRGAPALFAREHFPRLLQLEGDRGAGSLLRTRAHEVVTVTLDPSALRDVDTHADLETVRTLEPGLVSPADATNPGDH